jgi:hypothetical protein
MADNSFVSIFGSSGGGGGAPASCCWIVQCGTGINSTERICAVNNASGDFSTAFGSNNTTSAQYSTISGGYNNLASGQYSSIGGGLSNISSGWGLG